MFPTQPEGTGQTDFYYPDANTVERKQLVSGSVWTDLYVRFDGVGRESRRITANGEASPWDQADTCYDARGHVAFVSYPYQGNGFSTAQRCSGLGDSFTYDPLGRKTVVTHSDSTQINYSYAGPTTSVTDEGNGNGATHVQRISQLDGLGRLINVCEVSANAQQGVSPAPCNLDISGTGFLTSYAYAFDASTSNVKVTATQGSLNARISTTNSLGWLIAAQNPESGTLTYGYDEDGSVITRTAPAPNQTGSGTVTATITYDPSHRPRTKSYSDNTTPSVTINYDETSVFGRTLGNTKGRESSTYMTTVVSPIGTQAAEVFSYDVMGRTRDNSQCTPQNCGAGTVFPMTYTYDLVGDMLTGTNGLGTTLTYAYNQAARVTGITSSLSDANHPGTLLSGVHYNAFGGDTSATLGNSVAETAGYAPRGWLQSLSANLNSTTLYSFSLGFSPNGDVTTGNDSVNGNWNYAYDEFNRLCASNNGGQQSLTCTSTNNAGLQAFSYVYDRYGNRWQQNVTAGSGNSSSLAFDLNNRIVGGGVTYDAAGNVTQDPNNTYTYDAENRVIATRNQQSGVLSCYAYDAAGDRVRKTTGASSCAPATGGTSVDYLYDLADHVVTEVSAAGVWNRGEVFAGGHHIATYAGGASGTTTFTHADWLGTERARTGTSGTVIETCTNLPFGDGQSCSGSGGDPSPLHFTGKQRDTETNNDDFGARYFNSGMGRWLTPDWSAKPAGTPYSDPANPQTLNLYAYVGNNPVTHTDPDGHEANGGSGPCLGMLMPGGEIIYTAIKTVKDTLNKLEAQKEQAQALQKAQVDSNGNPTFKPTPPAAPKLQYHQKTGEMDLKAGSVVTPVGTGYAGHGLGLNNPAYQHVAGDTVHPDNTNAGPLPQGNYTIGPEQLNVTSDGTQLKNSMALTPDPANDMTGRGTAPGNFLIHGAPEYDTQTHSQGCPVMKPEYRDVIGHSGVKGLEVVE